MRYGRAARHAVRQISVKVGELDLPVPFDLGTRAGQLERRDPRAIRLVPVTIEPGNPSGLWARTAAADYIYYEQQTSPFHQAHIAAHLVAYVVLGPEKGASIDRRLVPDVSTELVQMILGDTAGTPVTELEAETFAFLLLERAGLLAGLKSGTWRRLRELRPLWAALREAVPEAECAVSGGARLTARSRLYRRVIEIRDAALALRPYQDPAARAAATTAAHERWAGRGRPCRHGRGRCPRRCRCAPGRPVVLRTARIPGTAGPAVRGGVDLVSEAAWLVKVSRAFASSPLVRELAGGGSAAPPPARSAPSGLGERPHRR